jgi:uncharacterized DUF497 family protein
LNIKGFIWLSDIVNKLATTHAITPKEVEEAFRGTPKFKRGPRGHRHGENGYYCLGRSATGRYLFVFFIFKRDQRALIISARDMTNAERRYYGRR